MQSYLIYAPACITDNVNKLQSANSNYDVHINYYDCDNIDGYWYTSSYVKGHKWQVFGQLYGNIDMKQYDYIMFIDLDVDFHFNISDFFRHVASNRYEIAQPALSKNSHASHGHLMYAGKGDRKVPFCEIMCPCVRGDVVCEMYENGLFEISESGWGIDKVWGSMYENICCDGFQMTHGKKISSQNWRLTNGLTPIIEMEKVEKYYRETTWKRLK